MLDRVSIVQQMATQFVAAKLDEHDKRHCNKIDEYNCEKHRVPPLGSRRFCPATRHMSFFKK
jgi:hypothetical protein